MATPKFRKEYKETTNRSVYNKARKWVLEHDCEIHCAWCKYHENENATNKYYGDGRWYDRHPNWKLVSKGKKQWYQKIIILEPEEGRFDYDGTWHDYGFNFKW